MMSPHKPGRLTAVVAVVGVILFCLAFLHPAQAAVPVKLRMDPSVTQKLTLTTGQSLVAETSADVRRVALGSADFADVKVLSPRQLYEILKLEYPVLWTGMKSFPAEGRGDLCYV